MQKLAQKLMTIEQRNTQTMLPSAIFGSMGNIQGMATTIGDGTRLRIGLWPCVNASVPKTAMGLWTVFAYLLDQYRNTRVYRLFTRIEAETPDDSYTWDISQSQFDIDDWSLDVLDENIAMWGKLEVRDAGWLLTAYYENDLIDDEDADPHQATIEAPTIAGLVAKLPEFASGVMQAIGQTTRNEFDLPYEAYESADEALTKDFIETAFKWENNLLLTLWGVDWDDADILALHNELQDLGLQLASDSAAWLVARASARAMLPGFSVVGELLVDYPDQIMANFPNSRQTAIVLGNALYRLGYAEEAYRLLEAASQQQPEHALTWYTLSDLYWRSGRAHAAAKRLQTAIETNATNAPLYRLYAHVVQAAESTEPVEEVVLADPDKHGDDVVAWEALAAYEKALELRPDDVTTLAAMADLLVLRDDKRFWEVFEQLVMQDQTGEAVNLVLESLYNVDEIEPAINIFEKVIAQHSDRADLHANLAGVYLIDDLGAEARDHLDKALEHDITGEWRNEIERMMLVADDPDFEMRFSDIQAIVDAGNKPANRDMEYLEGIIEDVPNFVEAYLILARAYNAWGDTDGALQLLLDAQKQFPEDPNVLALLGKQLLDVDEEALALQYLNQGLQIAPNHVLLLVTTGSLLFDSGHRTEARAYLTRAEALSPRHPDLWQVKTRIASIMATEDANADDDTDANAGDENSLR